MKLLKEPEERIRWLKPDEAKRLEAACSPELWQLVQAARFTGLRQAELVALRKADVDLKRQLLTVRQSKSNRPRVLPITADLVPVLKAAVASSEHDRIFSSSLGTPWTVSGVNSAWQRATCRAEISDLRFHDLRHDFATSLRRHGVGIDVISKLLGHSDLRTSKRYTHLGEDQLRDAVGALSAGAKRGAKK
ncbi:MAG: tyrosine-type recombinase/integrase [Polyangiales bacterium]